LPAVGCVTYIHTDVRSKSYNECIVKTVVEASQNPKLKQKPISYRDTRKSVSAAVTKDKQLIGVQALHVTGLPNR